MREIVTFECSQCHRRNYTSTRNKRIHTDRLELKKFCRFCRAQTQHRETK